MNKKTDEFKTLTLRDMEEKLKQDREHLSRLRFSHEVSPLSNPIRIREARRGIARLLTQIGKKRQEELSKPLIEKSEKHRIN
ncbi:MAG: 50S ribosomal protein L29 [Cytophagales bacterium]|nr:50S ribosomal protein L29 [Cytophagales bacterium]